MFSGDPDVFAARLGLRPAGHRGGTGVDRVRPPPRGPDPEDTEAGGLSTPWHPLRKSGPMTLEKLLTNITNHIPHHVGFIEEKTRRPAKRIRLPAAGPTRAGRLADSNGAFSGGPTTLTWIGHRRPTRTSRRPGD